MGGQSHSQPLLSVVTQNFLITAEGYFGQCSSFRLFSSPLVLQYLLHWYAFPIVVLQKMLILAKLRPTMKGTRR